jgi:hypothetical protein
MPTTMPSRLKWTASSMPWRSRFKVLVWRMRNRGMGNRGRRRSRNDTIWQDHRAKDLFEIKRIGSLDRTSPKTLFWAAALPACWRTYLPALPNLTGCLIRLAASRRSRGRLVLAPPVSCRCGVRWYLALPDAGQGAGIRAKILTFACRGGNLPTGAAAVRLSSVADQPPAHRC